MKTVKVSIDGRLRVCEFCPCSKCEDPDGFLDNYLAFYGWESIYGVYINDSDDDVSSEKGKYFKTREYFHKMLKDELPVELHHDASYTEKFSYDVQLEDDEEFDISKVQLIKSDYELQCFPYFILAEKIMYDGKEVSVSDDDVDRMFDYCVDTDDYNEEIIESFFRS